MIVFVRRDYIPLNNLFFILIDLNIAFFIYSFLCKFLCFLVASSKGACMFTKSVKIFSNKLKPYFTGDIALKACSKDAIDMLTSSKSESRSKFLKQYLYFIG